VLTAEPFLWTFTSILCIPHSLCIKQTWMVYVYTLLIPCPLHWHVAAQVFMLPSRQLLCIDDDINSQHPPLYTPAHHWFPALILFLIFCDPQCTVLNTFSCPINPPGERIHKMSSFSMTIFIHNPSQSFQTCCDCSPLLFHPATQIPSS
jgi:hypothetical protein